MGREEKETKVSGQPEAPAPVLAGIAWSRHWKLASGVHPWLCGELCACLRESSIWSDANDCGDLRRPGGAAREGEVGRGMAFPGHQAGPRSADPEKGSGRSADTDKI